ncbi:MAG: sigma-70 family RNA polymerase sigma factor [Lachnospiraceae bacterium]|nr:sigma-70 family RNA polymerase sigma factor [Lachnospiraceae bacterium]
MKASFETVYDENFKYIYNYLYTQTLHRETAEDLAMDVFVRAMEHYDGYDPERASVRTWLVTIARNCLINHRKMASYRRTENIDDAPEPGRSDEYGFRQDAISAEVNRILAKLSPKERELLAMRYMMELDNRAIGELTGADSKTVSQRIMRLLQKCKKFADGSALLTDD